LVEETTPLFSGENPHLMDQLVQTRTYALPSSTMDDAWEMILGQLQSDMDKTSFETWVKPLRPVSFRDGVFTVGARNTYGRDWVEARLRSRVTQMLEGMLAAQRVLPRGRRRTSPTKGKTIRPLICC
jgi:hypothetical protein